MLAQIILNNLLLASTKNRSLFYKLLFLCRKFILLFGDVNVVFKYHQFSLQIPFSHDLPLNMKMFPTYNVNLGKIVKIVHEKYSDLKVIDVGANIGDSLAVMHHEAAVPTLCIEGNPIFLKLLEQNIKQFKNIEIEASFVGEKSIKVNPQNNLGTAFLKESSDGIIVHTMQEVISKHPNFADAKLLKIDTDGFDNIIIRASKELLLKAKPVIFFEYDPYYLAKQNEIGTDIFDFLEDLNYSSIIVFDNFGFYLTTFSLTNKNLLKDLHKYFDRNGNIYMDICVLHSDDNNLIKTIQTSEYVKMDI